MTIQVKILLLSFVLLQPFSLCSQALKGKIFNMKDSLPIMHANITLIDYSGNILTGTTTDKNGLFIIHFYGNAYSLRIFQLQDFAELHIVNLAQKFNDTLDLGHLPMIEAPKYLEIQHKGLTERKERREQRKLIMDYNKQILRYKGVEIEINKQIIKLSVKKVKQTDSERLKLVYILNFEDIRPATP